MKPVVIYHDNCVDGFGAAFAAWCKFGEDAVYIPAQYGEDSFINALASAPNGIEDQNVFVLDFSFPYDDMELLFAKAHRVVWLDHHKTAFEMWCPEALSDPAGFLDASGRHHIRLAHDESGAALAWRYFHLKESKRLPLLIRHIDDYDRWQFKLAGTKAINQALRSWQPWTFEQWAKEFIVIGDEKLDSSGAALGQYEALLQQGATLLRAHEQRVRATVERARSYSLGQGLVGLAVNCPHDLASDVGHALAVKSGTYGLCWSADGHMVKCSLRSNGDYDVSVIAREFGGGGHRNAAGFEVSPRVFFATVS